MRPVLCSQWNNCPHSQSLPQNCQPNWGHLAKANSSTHTAGICQGPRALTRGHFMSVPAALTGRQCAMSKSRVHSVKSPLKVYAYLESSKRTRARPTCIACFCLAPIQDHDTIVASHHERPTRDDLAELSWQAAAKGTFRSAQDCFLALASMTECNITLSARLETSCLACLQCLQTANLGRQDRGKLETG